MFEKVILEEGIEQEQRIKDKTIVEMLYTGFIKEVKEDNAFDYQQLLEDPFIIRIGNNQVLPSLELALKTMKKSEKSQIYIQKQYGFNQNNIGKLESKVINEDLIYEVQILNFYEKEELDNFIDRFQIGEINKEKGNQEYKNQNYESAKQLYQSAISNLEFDDNQLARKLKLDMYNNLSLIYFKQKNYKESIEYCDKAIDIDSNNMKAHLRKANSYVMLLELDEVGKVMNKIKELDMNGEYSNEIKLLEKEEKKIKKEYLIKEKMMFFGKMN